MKEIKKTNTDLKVALAICLLFGILAWIGTDSFLLGIAAVGASMLLLVYLGFIHDKLNDIMKINGKILKEIKKLNKK